MVKEISNHIRLSEELNERLKGEAKRNNMSKAETIEMICREYFNVEEIKKGDESLKQIVRKLSQQNENLNNNLINLTIRIEEVLAQLD